MRVPENFATITDPDELRIAAYVAAEKLNQQVDDWRAGQTVAAPNAPRVTLKNASETLSAAIALYLQSDHFKTRAFNTQRGYRQDCKALEEWAGKEMLRAISREDLEELQATAREEGVPSVANKVARMARIIWNFAIDKQKWKDAKGTALVNIADKPDIRASKPSGCPWSSDGIDAFIATADALGHFSVGTAIKLNSWIGQRQADILNFKRGRLRDDCLVFDQRKTGKQMRLSLRKLPDVLERLKAELQRQRDRAVIGGQYLLLSEGENIPYSEWNFRRKFRRIRNELIATMLRGKGWYLRANGFDWENETFTGLEWWNDTVAAELKRQRLNETLEDAMARVARRTASFDVRYAVNDRDDEDTFRLYVGDMQFCHLRHTAITRLASAPGNTSARIAVISGHTIKHVDTILERYLIGTEEMVDDVFAVTVAHEARNKQ